MSSSTRTLYGLNVSPWTERARWALDHHGIEYAYHEHVPLIGELLLRRKARVKNATVPLFADGEEIVMGSYEIAQHAEKIGEAQKSTKPSLIEPSDAEAITKWSDVAQQMTSTGRAWLTRKLLASRAAQREALPSFIPSPFRGAFAPTSAMAIRFIAKKHGVPINEEVDAEVDKVLRPLLEDIRKTLGDRDYLLSKFSFADVAIAASLQVVRPREASPFGPAMKEAWTNPNLVEDFGDLLKWRDAIYAKHR